MGDSLDENLRALRLVGASAHPLAALLLLQFADAALTLAHSLQEWYEPAGRELGLKRALLTLLGVSGLAEEKAR